VKFVRELPLHVRQRRALVAFHDRTFQSGDYQELNRVNRDVAYRELQELEGKHLVIRNSEARGRIYSVPKSVLEEASGALSALQRVIATMEAAGKLTNSDLREMSGVDRSAASRALAELVQSGHLVQQGERRGVHYVPGPNWPPTTLPRI
jgi:predicted HTH transcriptional regulator